MWLSIRFWFIVNMLAIALLLAVHFAFGPTLKEFWWWTDLFGVLAGILIGGIISFLFYFLVVFVPERRKRLIIKSNLRKVYRNIKRDILWQIVFASIQGGRSDLTTSVEQVDKLMGIEAFKAAFAHGREATEGFYAFENQMSQDTYEFRQIILNLQILSKQIDYVLHNYPIQDQNVFDFFKRLEAFLMRIQHLTPGYDESKALCQFIWEIFAGFNFVEGDRGYDIIEKMIHDI
jgi:hypothetical protein